MTGHHNRKAIVIGSTGGIGNALFHALVDDTDFDDVVGLSRTSKPQLDLTSEKSIADAAASLSVRAPFHLIMVATGLLHDDQTGLQPEKRLGQLDPAKLAQAFAINTIGPALIAKHFFPLMAKDRRSIFAALSARVSSISDNRAGGWYGYRASKAALNMIIKNLSIEWGRTNKNAIAVGLHPGTVDTQLSKPFQGNVKKLFAPESAAAHLREVLDSLDMHDTGRLLAWNGEIIEP